MINKQAKYSFDINTAKDFFDKLLLKEYENVKKKPLSSRYAIICSILSWHLADWVYNEFLPTNSKYKNLRDFQSYITHQCPQLQIMHDIAIGSKHYDISYAPAKKKQVVAVTKHLKAAFDPTCFDSRCFQTYVLEVQTKDGKYFDFAEMLEKAIEFWRNYFNTIS